MNYNLKPVGEQTIVITGASSGIGLVTARMAAKRGARLVLAARSEDALRKLCDELNQGETRAIHVVADVGREDQVHRIAHTAISHFGGIDTWVNDAGLSVYGRIMDVPIEDMHRLIDTDFWGVVYGSRIAVRHMSSRGGALINIGSVVSDRAIPMQGIYSAAKHAVKGFTNALRMELEEANVPISVSLIKPTGINTPFPDHAQNYMDRSPTLPPPVYAPEAVAEAILHCAETPERELFIGSGAKVMSASEQYAPRLTDKLMEGTMFEAQKADRPPRSNERSSLYHAGADLQERGSYDGHTMETSFYTKATMHPMVTGAVLLGAGLAIAKMWKPSYSNS